jgi:hypothetical protein
MISVAQTDAYDLSTWTTTEPRRRSQLEWLMPFALGALGWWASGDWIGGAGAVALWIGWQLLLIEHTPPVLAWAFSFQWLQVTIGIYYSGLTGRVLRTMKLSDYRPMILIGLGCVLALAVGLRLGVSCYERFTGSRPGTHKGVRMKLSWPLLATCYVLALALNGTILAVAVQFPALTQALFALTSVRLGLLLLILRRLVQPPFRPGWFALLLAVEVVLGLSGFFAGFKEPLMIALIALFEMFDRRRVAHWMTAGVLLAACLCLSVMWISVRRDYRADYSQLGSRTARLEKVGTLANLWWDQNNQELMPSVDDLVERLWAVYYPALAVARVPSVLPYTDGALLEAAVVQALEPRILFPDKPPVPSDSDKVRRYSGIYVAGAESNTSIAFGYAAESYIDFGLPWMFAPIFVFGLLMGVAYVWFLVNLRHGELSTALVTVVFWLSLYLFEKSWPFMIGQAGTMLLYLGTLTFFIDRYLYARHQTRGA